MLFKVRNNSNGTYSKGGQDVDLASAWSRTGKLWTSKNAFVLHLRQLKRPESVYADCTVIMIDDAGKEPIKEVPFEYWYEQYLASKPKKAETKKVPSKFKSGDPVMTPVGVGEIECATPQVGQDCWLVKLIKGYSQVYRENELTLLVPKV